MVECDEGAGRAAAVPWQVGGDGHAVRWVGTWGRCQAGSRCAASPTI